MPCHHHKSNEQSGSFGNRKCKPDPVQMEQSVQTLSRIHICMFVVIIMTEVPVARNKYPEEAVEKILDVAERLFVERGYEHTTMI